MNNDQLLKILQKYLDGKASLTEKKAVEAWFESADEKSSGQDLPGDPTLAKMRDSAFQRFLSATQVDAPAVPLYKKTAFRAAAALLILFATIGYLIYSANSKPAPGENPGLPVAKNDIAAPRLNKAVLQLSDGSIVDIDGSLNDTLAVQGAVHVIRKLDGVIRYSGNDQTLSYNTLSVPRGSRPQQLQLADGSIAWLNVESSITYPVAFTEGDRKVEIRGEVYFEIAKKTDQPFVVKNEGRKTEIRVTGTHFNVNGYEDEGLITVTLLEGGVQVIEEKKIHTLKPGQQARVKSDLIHISNSVDLDGVMAWKDGKFKFDGADIQSIMRQVSKWYDVEVEFESEPTEKLVASISRDVNMSELLEILERTDLIHFDVQGKKIIVKK